MLRSATQFASDAAGVLIQQLNVAAVEVDSAAPNHGVLSVAMTAHGSYGQLKAWQASIQQAVPSLSLKSMSLVASDAFGAARRPDFQPEGNRQEGQLTASYVWQLWVRLNTDEPVKQAMQEIRPAMFPMAENPFVVTPPRAEEPTEPPAEPSPPPVAFVPAPTPPLPLPTWETLGQLEAQEGNTIVMGRWNNGPIEVMRQGQTAANGYQLQSIEQGVLVFSRPGLPDAPALRFSLPKKPRFETR
ncbi:hypothetical protein [Hydrogenophaga sp. 5NK40-0174]|uniref:hypothetical protein n=1 Tax=Hydrogenophaga sp. 5NK40-0174 TaxID=3127649 RepID=UPI0033410E4A